LAGGPFNKLTPSEVAQVLGTSAEYKVSEVADRNAGIVAQDCQGAAATIDEGGEVTRCTGVAALVALWLRAEARAGRDNFSRHREQQGEPQNL
jgi:hypothetical protein